MNGRTLQELGGRLQELTGLAPALQAQLLKSLIVVVLLGLARWLALRVIWRQTTDVRTRYRWRKLVTYLVVALGLVLVGRIWFEGIQTIATFLGLLTAGLAIALRDPIVNFAGWLFILWRRPFVVGDRVQVGEHAGDVIDLRVFQFTLLEIGKWVEADQSTGRLIHVPNGVVFRDPVANFTRGFNYIWNEIPVLVTFESDWRKAKAILTEIVERHGAPLSEEAERSVLEASRRFLIFYSTLRPRVYTRVQDSGVLLTIRYLTEPRRRRGTEEAIWEDVLDAFAGEPAIDFAYPTQRFYSNAMEGKPALRPEGERGPEGGGA